ncbi:hypothetical protein H7198_06860 [Fructobacillus sp. CRL 2054]|uniref:hypothetical protein n=1 Tax=Fructobacillus sp. CRL 2054 TaxID=2763007 RepID=UPI0023787B6A|nr:hypothetical protein [Fructobacillus sp. CRL 2054]MDD9139304.1 hypothetical protein [Fructobacillus sp. CRL 2054]
MASDNLNIVQYPDADGHKAYVKTHVQAVDGLSDDLAKALEAGNYFLLDYVILKSANGTKYKLFVSDNGGLFTERSDA